MSGADPMFTLTLGFGDPSVGVCRRGGARSEEINMLGFGYNDGIPEGVHTAWGCRALVTQDGAVDMLPDRTSLVGPEKDRVALADYLGANVGGKWVEEARRLLKERKIHTCYGDEVVLFEDPRVIVKGNTNSSAGYLYVCAYFKPNTEA